jgi:threonine dehydratase
VQLVTIDDIRSAAARLRGVAVRTPLLPCPWAPGDQPLWLKPESLQPVGSFKLRGAVNAVARLDPRARARGVVAYSSGNHAQAVAFAARTAGIPAVIVIEDTAPAVKVERTRAHGAEVVLVPLTERESAAHEIAADRQLALIPPFDHPDVIAGQGTVGLEIVADLPAVDVVLVPVSGGGLAAGIAAAVKALRPQTKVIGVEPELAADTAQSLAAGELVRWPAGQRARTIADGLRAQPSELTFTHLRTLVDGVVTVTEQQIRAAVLTLAHQARLVAEPSGAATTAAFQHRAAELPAGNTVAVVSGGNIDSGLLAELLRPE